LIISGLEVGACALCVQALLLLAAFKIKPNFDARIIIMNPNCFIPFPRPVAEEELPKMLNFPFYHTPHPLCIEAAKELQQYIHTQTEWEHNFGLDDSKTGLVIGKMFGVMLVKNETGQIGYLTAFSGKLANSNRHSRFVPPIFDMLDPNSFFLQGEKELTAISTLIQELEEAPELKAARERHQNALAKAASDIEGIKQKIKTNKVKRNTQRADAKGKLTAEELTALNASLNLESSKEQGELKFVQRYWAQKIAEAYADVQKINDQIEILKQQRKDKSSALQERLFAQYNFVNAKGEFKNVKELFAHLNLVNPPSGAGECAAPKLLQYAYLNNLKPLSFAEFWWGASPVSEVRKHAHFYPACRGKCEPILGHMLQGMDVEPNPMADVQDLGAKLHTIYEDEYIVVVDKPADLLSVPGKIDQTSVLEILEKRYPNATGPILVHRLDMATSGILIAAKTKEAHQYLQAQFIKKRAKKSYIAVLQGILSNTKGTIALPLRVDLDNRPHQLVCFEYGKPAITEWELIAQEQGNSRVRLFPITGRTHQLRVHCAHQAGLNLPIVGDDLYGTKADRLHLHAHTLTIKHPATRLEMHFESPVPF
jgi:tRNA pseudouridine32 synthase/23S rRNA pseudouridine746 synthase